MDKPNMTEHSMQEQLVAAAKEGQTKIVVPFSEDFADEIKSIRDEYEIGDQLVEIEGYQYKTSIESRKSGNVLVATKTARPQRSRFWIKAEKKSPESIDAFRQMWLDYIEENGVHDPKKEIKADQPYRLWEAPPPED